jgi:hypothetical protein
MPVPYAFSAATSAIPLSQLDANFNTTITLGNTAIQLGNTVTTLNNMTLANVTISSGNVTITNVTVTTANVTTVNATTVIATTANVTTGNVTNLISGNVSLTGGSITGTSISGSTGSFTTLTTSSTVTLNGGTAGGVAYLDGSKVLTTGSALTFDGDSFVVGGIGKFGRINAQRFASSPQATITIGDNTTLSNDVGIYFRQTSGVSGFSTAGSDFAWYNGGPGISEQMRLTSTGLGIGESSPAAKLDVVGLASNVGFKLRSGGNTGINILDIADAGGAGQFVLNASGNLGIGTSSPAAKLHVIGNSYFQSGTLFTDAVTAYSGTTLALSAGSTAMTFTVNGAERMRLDSSGNLGIGTTPGTTLDVYKATGNSIIRAWAASGIPRFDLRSATRYYSVSIQSDNLTFFDETAGSTRMTLDSSGNLGIGTSSTGQKLDVSGAIRSSNAGSENVLLSDGSTASGLQHNSNALYYNVNNNSATHGQFIWRSSNAYTERARIDSSGNLIQTVNTTAATLSTNGTLTFSIVDNSTLRISVRGSDGTTRTATVALT